jgi:hypothetical protein
MNRMKLVAGCLTGAGVVALFAGRPEAYSTFSKWGSNSVVFYANPANADVDATAAETAIKFGLNVWSTEAGSSFRYIYGGRVNDTSTANDGRNVVIFRNASNGGALATTYSWWSGSSLVDSDVIVWDGAYTFFTGTSGCAGGAYLEDVLTHELGHALGLNHSGDVDATMYPSISWCAMDMRTLAADDIAAAQSLYGRATAAATNTPPTLSISSPTGGSFLTTTNIAFSASANDSQDGNLSSQIVWTSNLLSQPIGFGSSLAAPLPAGTNLVNATVTDSGGMTTSKSVTITVTVPVSVPPPAPPPPPAPTTTPVLAASAYKVGKNLRTDLTWSGFTASTLDVYRNGSKVTSTTNDGTWTDAIKRAGTYRYKACAAGTSTCSNEATATF